MPYKDMFISVSGSAERKAAGGVLVGALRAAGETTRLRALARRALGADDVVQVGRLLLQRKNRRILVDDQDLALPAREFEVLWELMSPPGRTVSKRELSDKLSSFEDALADNALEAFISRLRKKLSDSGATIRTLRGIGYLLEEEKDPA
jgi:DNA-binding response OmpR family regulator